MAKGNRPATLSQKDRIGYDAMTDLLNRGEYRYAKTNPPAIKLAIDAVQRDFDPDDYDRGGQVRLKEWMNNARRDLSKAKANSDKKYGSLKD